MRSLGCWWRAARRLITGGVKSWSVVSALQEAGLEVVGTSVKKSTKEDKDRIREIMGDDAHMIDDMTPREMYAMLREARAGPPPSCNRSTRTNASAADVASGSARRSATRTPRRRSDQRPTRWMLTR